jgi:hypothetical protein
MTFEDEYYIALAKCGERYAGMALYIDWEYEGDEELFNFIVDFREGVQNRLPLMKLNRWLGYIQGCLIDREHTTVQAERDWTRPLFRSLDFRK